MTPKELLKKVKEEEGRVLTRVKNRTTSNSDFLDNLFKGLKDIRDETSFYWGRDWLFRKRYAPFELYQSENNVTVRFGRGRWIFCTFIGEAFAPEYFDISCSNKVLLEDDDDICEIIGVSNTLNTSGHGAVSAALELIMKVLVKFEEGGTSENLED